MTGRENVVWPGSAGAAIQEIERCHEEWTSFIDSMDEADLRSDERCRWPFKGQSLCSLALWLNVELMKNAAEIGAARFLLYRKLRCLRRGRRIRVHQTSV